MTSTAHSKEPSLFEIVEEVANLSVGSIVLLMPALILAAPGVILFVVLPAVAVLVPVAIVGAIAAPPFLLVRAMLRRR
jgi:hypothetical protein